MTAFALLSAIDCTTALAQDSMAYRTSATSSAASASSIFLPYAQFQIPFNVDNAGSQPSAVQLMVSTDGGKTWQQHGRANPADRHFDFRAAAEGEYLFTVQTVDSAGIAFPSPNLPMRIQVDTTKPQAAVRADLDQSGNLIVDLRVADDHIDLKSAVLKIRTDRDPQWREVLVESLSAVSGFFEGQVEVLIPQCREIAIVFSINDQAKNTGTASYLFTMPRTAAQNKDLQLASAPSREVEQFGGASNAVRAPSQGILANPTTGKEIPGAIPWDLDRKAASQPNSSQGLSGANVSNQGSASYSSGANSVTAPNYYAQQPNSARSNTVRPVNPSLGGNPTSQPQAQQSSRQGNFPTTPRGSNLNALAQQAPGQNSSRSAVAEPNVLNASPSGLGRNPANGSIQPPGYIQNPAFTQGSGITQGPGQLARATLDVELSPTNLPAPEELSMPVPMNPATGFNGASVGVDSRQTQADPRAFQHTHPQVTEAENGINNPYYCKSTTFSLDYSVEALGGNALSEVELWGTEDNGRTWEKWGSDPDRVSPFDVKVGNDGLFGFRMVLIGPGGSVMGTPKPGDDADAWIRVDSQQPNCKITRALYGVGSEAGMLVIDYTCTDDDLADEGITLSWSPTLDGPWTPFASAIRNSGLYLWKADASLPSRVYLKLDAVDKAGNTGTHKMDLPIDTKGLSPRGRIQGIRPLPAK
ncbi:MAG: hypothetical protein U0930_19445 [Pirellulales bacterium]